MKFPKKTLLAGLVYGMTAMPAMAAVLDEAGEPNNTAETAQVLPVENVVEVNGILNARDIDVYAIDVQADDTLTFDIDCGYSCGASVIAQIHVIDGTDPLLPVLTSNFNGGVLDEGSLSPYDPIIENFSLGKAGRVYVVISHYDSIVEDGMVVTYQEYGGSANDGDYKLVISGATGVAAAAGTVAETVEGDQIIQIEIKPFSRGKWPRINPRSRGRLPVAILSQDGFDPLAVDVESLRFGATGEEDSMVRCRESRRDINRDGSPDLMCFFSIRKAGFDESSATGKLTGTLEDGTQFVAEATLRMVPTKRPPRYGYREDRPRGRR